MGEPFENHNQIETWLINQPHDVISVFAARAALRAIPQFAYLITLTNLKLSIQNIILLSIQATATSLSVGLWPNKFVDLMYDTADAVAYAAYTVSHANSANSASYTAVTAAADAAYAAYAASDSNAATYAAYAADAAATFNAEAIQTEYSQDRDFIESGRTARELSERPLFNQDTSAVFDLSNEPLNVTENWYTLKSYLLSLNQDWDVWTDWYDARLEGRPLIKEIEIGLNPDAGQYGRATLPPEYYEEPAKANAAIKDIIDAYWERQRTQNPQENSDIPAQNPASIKPVIRNGKIYLSDEPIHADLELHLAIENMLALRDEFEEFFTSIGNEGNFDKRPIDFLKTISALIPNDIPDSRTLFRLIRKEATMEKYEETVLQEWPQFFADRYTSLLTELGQVLDQFPDRRAFQRQKLSAEIEDVDFDEFKQDFEPVLEAIKTETAIIDQTVPKAIADIGELSDGAPKQDEQRVIIADQLDSTNNVLKTLTDKALDPIAREQAITNIGNAYGRGMTEGVLEGARKAGIEDGKKIGAAIARAEAAKTAGQAIYDKYPERFHWLKRILRINFR